MLRNRNVDLRVYGEKEFIADVVFKLPTKSFKYLGDEIEIPKECNVARLAAKVIAYPVGSYEWENEMYNAIIDSMEGTDWSRVRQLII